MNISFWLTLETFSATGLLVLIWLIQILHYPSFTFYDAETFKLAMDHHQKRISYIVIPLMLIEIFSAGMIVYLAPNLRSAVLLIIICLIWVSTFLLQVPLHGRLLQEGKRQDWIDRLVLTNWLRTGLWTLKFLIVISFSS